MEQFVIKTNMVIWFTWCPLVNSEYKGENHFFIIFGRIRNLNLKLKNKKKKDAWNTLIKLYLLLTYFEVFKIQINIKYAVYSAFYIIFLNIIK